MRFDLRNQLADAQVVTATAVSTNSMKKKEITQDLGIGKTQMGLVFGAAPVTGGATYTVELIEADDAALTSNVVVLSSMVLTAAQLLKYPLYFLALPGYKMSKEFYGARFTVTGGSTPSATFNAYFGSENDVGNYKSFKTSYTVAN